MVDVAAKPLLVAAGATNLNLLASPPPPPPLPPPPPCCRRRAPLLPSMSAAAGVARYLSRPTATPPAREAVFHYTCSRDRVPSLCVRKPFLSEYFSTAALIQVSSVLCSRSST